MLKSLRNLFSSRDESRTLVPGIIARPQDLESIDERIEKARNVIGVHLPPMRMPRELRNQFDEVVELLSKCVAGKLSPPTPAEIALAYTAFFIWRMKASDDENYYVDPSGTARFSACVTIAHASNNKLVVDEIKKQKSSFDPQRELVLAEAVVPPEVDGWGDCVTRFAIMGGRRLTFACTGQVDSFVHLDCNDLPLLTAVGLAITTNALGRDVTAHIYRQ